MGLKPLSVNFPPGSWVSSLVRLSETPSCHAGFRLPCPTGRSRRSNQAHLRLLQRPATMLSRGHDFDAGANNWVGSDRDPSGIATYRGITSAGCLRSFPAPEACDPRSSHSILAHTRICR